MNAAAPSRSRASPPASWRGFHTRPAPEARQSAEAAYFDTTRPLEHPDATQRSPTIHYHFTTATPESDAKQSHQTQIDISVVQYRKGRNTGVSLIYRYPMYFGPVPHDPGTGSFFILHPLSSGPFFDGRRVGGVDGLTWAHNGKGAASARPFSSPGKCR